MGGKEEVEEDDEMRRGFEVIWLQQAESKYQCGLLEVLDIAELVEITWLRRACMSRRVGSESD